MSDNGRLDPLLKQWEVKQQGQNKLEIAQTETSLIHMDIKGRGTM